MKRFIQFGEVIVASITLFLFLPEISNWISTGHFSISMREFREAIFLGIFTPVVVWLSRKIRNDAAFVLFVVLIIVLILAIVPHLRW